MYKKFLCFMYSVCMDSMSFYVNAFSSFASTPRADVFVAAWSVSFQHLLSESWTTVASVVTRQSSCYIRKTTFEFLHLFVSYHIFLHLITDWRGLSMHGCDTETNKLASDGA